MTPPSFLLTSELQSSELEGDQSIADLHQVNQGVEVVWGQDKTVSCGVVPPAAQQQVSTEAVLQGARQVLIEDRIQVVVVRTWRRKGEINFNKMWGEKIIANCFYKLVFIFNQYIWIV